MNLPVNRNIEPKRVLILGAGGHDGPFLSQILSKNFHVVAAARKMSSRLKETQVETIIRDFSQTSTLREVVSDSSPDVVVNLVSLSSVFACETNPELSYEINYQFVTKLADVLNQYSINSGKKTTFLQASSSEIFGSSDSICDESTPLMPISKYGSDKAKAHEFLDNVKYDGLDTKLAILFNHESEFRDPSFVSQKICTAAAQYRSGNKHKLTLGNVLSARDWGYAPDYMEAISRILNRSGNEKYVIASGELHSIQELIRRAFDVGENVEISTLFTTNTSLMRKNETKPLVGSAKLIQQNCDWTPTVKFPDMIEKMVTYQMNLLLK